jgi:hypothetical protein
LAIRDFAEGPAILPGDADRMGAPLGKAGFVEHQDALPDGQDLPQAPPDAVGVPRGIGDEVLKGLV